MVISGQDCFALFPCESSEETWENIKIVHNVQNNFLFYELGYIMQDLFICYK